MQDSVSAGRAKDAHLSCSQRTIMKDKTIIISAKDVVFSPAFVCLSVWLCATLDKSSARIWIKFSDNIGIDNEETVKLCSSGTLSEICIAPVNLHCLGGDLRCPSAFLVFNINMFSHLLLLLALRLIVFQKLFNCQLCKFSISKQFISMMTAWHKNRASASGWCQNLVSACIARLISYFTQEVRRQSANPYRLRLLLWGKSIATFKNSPISCVVSLFVHWWKIFCAKVLVMSACASYPSLAYSPHLPCLWGLWFTSQRLTLLSCGLSVTSHLTSKRLVVAWVSQSHTCDSVGATVSS